MVPDLFLQDLFLQSEQDLGFQARSQVQVPFWSYFEGTCVTSLCKLQVLVPLASLFQQFSIFRTENDEDSLGCLQILGSSGSTSRKQVYLATKSEKLPGQVSTGLLNAKRQKKTELLCLKRQGEHMPSKNGGFSTWDDENPNIKPFGHEPSKATHFFKTSLKVVTWKSRHENHRSLLCFGVCCSFPFVTQDPPPSLSSVRTCSGERSTYSAWNSLEHQGGKTCTTWLRQKHVVKPSWIFHFRGSIIWNLSPDKVMFV